jgi:hypothetical protein
MTERNDDSKDKERGEQWFDAIALARWEDEGGRAGPTDADAESATKNHQRTRRSDGPAGPRSSSGES